MIAFFVPGLPRPAGSKRAFPFRKKAGGLGVHVTDDCKGSRDWKTTVSWAAGNSYAGPLLQGPLRVALSFVMPRPKAHFTKRGLKAYAPLRPITKPDVLKLARGVEDALTAVLWHDDAQIVIESLEKCYGERPGVHVQVQTIVVAG